MSHPILGIDPGLETTGLCAILDRRIIYRGSIKTPSAWPDARRRERICADCLDAASKIPGLDVGAVWVEGYEYQGPRTHTQNAIRCSLLVGQIVGTLARSYMVSTVDRTVWGRALGVKTDADQARRIATLKGLKLKNAHERDAASVASFGQVASRQMEMVG